MHGGPDPGVAMAPAPAVQAGLGGLDGGVVGQGPPEPLRSNMVGFLHDALTVTPPRWARPNSDAVMFGDGGERGADPAGAGADHGRHPVETPVPAHPAQGSGDPVQAIDQVLSLIHISEPTRPY